MEEEKRRGVVLVPCPFQGHINPMLQLGTTLHSMGFSITVAHTQFNYPDPSKHPDFIFIPIQDALTDTNTLSGNLIPFIKTLNINCEVPLQECLAQMMDQNQDQHGKVVCIIYDTLMYFSEAVANHLKLPSIVLRTSDAYSSLAYRSVLRLQAEGRSVPSIIQDSVLQDLVPGLHPLRFKDLPLSNFGPLENLLQLVTIISNIRTSSAIIWNTMDYLECPSLTQLQQQYKVPLFSVGPLHKISPASSSSLLEEDANCISWLDKQALNSVIYVSLGSLASLDEAALTEMAWGLANSNQPFLWVVRPGSIRGSEWIELLPETFKAKFGDTGYIVKWAPQGKVLAHGAVGGFWSHCGWNSTLESICEGVPMICWPCFGDQKVNARYLSCEWRIGLELEHMERGNIERAVRRLMVDKEGEEMRQRAMDLKEKAEVCIRKGGSSYNSLNDLKEIILSF
ncbi:UDP-glucose iridoid glucosyltransferase-like isoform X2 [Cornus florida]|uniref:UDP-glucose iridoid glucosyltransferase-like isoform X2 n=1 Tax=Cornus florida TaxID=4283 RepID=UPI0028A1DD97|nr:UDP-glucose iridoid glucosyltransferase-like isoform X2 [Cornus florida]